MQDIIIKHVDYCLVRRTRVLKTVAVRRCSRAVRNARNGPNIITDMGAGKHSGVMQGVSWVYCTPYTVFPTVKTAFQTQLFLLIKYWVAWVAGSWRPDLPVLRGIIEMSVRGLGYIIPDLPPSEGKKPGPSYINI